MNQPILTSDATPEEVLTALAELGEDPDASRVQAVQAQLGELALQAGGREDAVRQAVDLARQQLDTQGKALQIPILKVGDKFTLATNETDCDEHDQERVTPAGSLWRVLELEPNCDPVMQYSVACDATGGWIHITHSELSTCGFVAMPDDLSQDVAPERSGAEMTRKRIMAVFQPQAWQNDHAIETDGRQDVDVTEKVLSLSLEQIHGLGDDGIDTDNLVDPDAHGHGGPYYVKAAEAICEYFGVEQLQQITDTQLAGARFEHGKMQTVVKGGIGELKEVGFRSVNAAAKAVEAHRDALGIEGDVSTQVWHLLGSLQEFCATHSVDLDEQLADVRRQLASGEIELPLSRASQWNRDSAPGLGM